MAHSTHSEPVPASNTERWVKGDGAWVLVPPRRSRLLLAVKRLIDIVVAATSLVLLSPVLIAVAIAIKLTSRGPIFYPWRVLGEFGRPFVGYKFRTMVRNADDLKAGLLHLNERTGPVFKIANDPRVTPLGRWLRKHSLDELPQLWSALVGDMSLVGPRPPGYDEYRNFDLWQMRKLSVKPGMTCLWQVEGRSTISDFADWARLDLQYIDAWSLWKDIAILGRTAAVVVKGTGV
jgi:lipopolysaccharide/colanic/teichoic acid biosynthesis glycosyltransferase